MPAFERGQGCAPASPAALPSGAMRLVISFAALFLSVFLVQLGSGSRLGWTSWVGGRDSTAEDVIILGSD